MKPLAISLVLSLLIACGDTAGTAPPVLPDCDNVTPMGVAFAQGCDPVPRAVTCQRLDSVPVVGCQFALDSGARVSCVAACP